MKSPSHMTIDHRRQYVLVSCGVDVMSMATIGLWQGIALNHWYDEIVEVLLWTIPFGTNLRVVMVMVPPCSFNLLCVQQSNHIWVALRPGATPLLQRSWRMPQGCSYRGRVHSICQLVHVVSWSDNRGVTGTFLSNYLIKTVHYQLN